MTSDSKKYWPIFVLIAAAAVFLTWVIIVFQADYYASVVSGEPYTDEMYAAFNLFYYIQSPLWAVMTIVTFVLCIRVFGINMSVGKIWLIFTVAMVFWFLGDAYYSYEWFAYANETLGTLHFGRICYIIGYLVILVALALQDKVGGLKLAKKEYAYIAVIEGIFLVVSLYFCVIPLSQLSVDGYYIADELDKAILVFYQVFDEVNIFLAILLIFKYRGGQFSTGWLILSIGFMTEAIYDMVYTVCSYILPQTVDPAFENAWYFFDPINYLAYVVLAVGALYLYISVRSAKV